MFKYSFVVLLLLVVSQVMCDSSSSEESNEAFTKVHCGKKPDVSSEESDENCAKPFTQVWTWSNSEQKCVSVEEKGCGISGNTFATEEECQKIAEPICGKVNTS